MRKDTVTIVVSGECSNCGCSVFPNTVGFECDDFIVCQACVDREEKDYQDFLSEIEV